jgi:phospholipase/lecithinase/hemolysin
MKKAVWAVALLPLPAAAQELNPRVFDTALKTAAQYAEDASLIFYCLRRDDVAELVHLSFHADIQDGVQRLRDAGASGPQISQFVKVVLTKVRLSTPAAPDANLDKACAAKDVAKARVNLEGVGAPMILRPPFDQLKK